MRGGDQRVAQHPPDIAEGLARQPFGRPAVGNPGIDVARPPIVGGQGVGPIAIAPEHLRQIGSAEQAGLAQIELDRATVAAYQRSLTIAQNRYKAGVAARVDVVQAEVQWKGAQAQLIDLGVDRAQLEHAIALLVGEALSAANDPEGAARALVQA